MLFRPKRQPFRVSQHTPFRTAIARLQRGSPASKSVGKSSWSPWRVIAQLLDTSAWSGDPVERTDGTQDDEKAPGNRACGARPVWTARELCASRRRRPRCMRTRRARRRCTSLAGRRFPSRHRQGVSRRRIRRSRARPLSFVSDAARPRRRRTAHAAVEHLPLRWAPPDRNQWERCSRSDPTHPASAKVFASDRLSVVIHRL